MIISFNDYKQKTELNDENDYELLDILKENLCSDDVFDILEGCVSRKYYNLLDEELKFFVEKLGFA